MLAGFVHGAPKDFPFHRDLRFPLTEEQLAPLDARCRRVQFLQHKGYTAPTDSDFVRLSQFLSHYPEVALRVCGHPGPIENLEFLRHFPALRRFACEVYSLTSLAGLRHLSPDLVSLELGQTHTTTSLDFLERFPRLQMLYLEGHSRGFEVLARLHRLQDLTLRSITVRSFDPLHSLPDLLSLDVKLGGSGNLEALRTLKKVRYLELWRVNGLTDLEPISGMEGLQYLFLEDLATVTALPPMENLTKLRRVDIMGAKRLRDISPLRDAPALEELAIGKNHPLRPSDLDVLRGHPTLKRLSVATGSLKRDRETEARLGFEPVTWWGKDDGFDFR